MKTFKQITGMALVSALAVFGGCTHVEHAANSAGDVAERGAHFAGHVAHKVGEGVENTGHEIERHVDRD